MFSSLAPARRRFVVGLLALVVAGAVGAVVAVMVASTDDGGKASDGGPVAQGTAGTVLLVPGYGGSTRSLQPLATSLRAAGKTVQVVSLPDDAEGDLAQQAVALGAAVDALAAQSVDVVGYSAGGVVARIWVKEHGGASKARRVITVGSPQHGTDIAGLAGSLAPDQCPTACQQLQPDSAVLTELNAGDETPAGPVFVSIWTTEDTVVLPPSSARLEGAVNMTVQSVCAGDRVNHGGLPGDAAVHAMVLAELSTSPPAVLGPANCPS